MLYNLDPHIIFLLPSSKRVLCKMHSDWWLGFDLWSGKLLRILHQHCIACCIPGIADLLTSFPSFCISLCLLLVSKHSITGTYWFLSSLKPFLLQFFMCSQDLWHFCWHFSPLLSIIHSLSSLSIYLTHTAIIQKP